MNYIGIRVSTSEVYYSIIKKNNKGFDVISISSIKVPKALEIPQKLSYVRNTLITIIEQYSIAYASMRVIEGAAMSNINSTSLFRVNLEGVIQEVFAGSTIEEYDLACNSSVSSILKTSSKKILDIFNEINLNEKYKTDRKCVLNDGHKEALVVAIAMQKKKGE
ncbi:hypothetical protein [uncultured Clostridium sp.]|uniref:hypothetical protein n=1 Tax=uncultured Clostridium sp. TaxID=59620 RepID=UPI0025E39CAE|nr:hypothetical protein [uncultured Clostridium sp.]MDU4883106.1 hypothetical protein [Clostridium celatum]MDU7076174.1 hypothetical protein [Clostridium celatum]